MVRLNQLLVLPMVSHHLGLELVHLLIANHSLEVLDHFHVDSFLSCIKARCINFCGAYCVLCWQLHLDTIGVAVNKGCFCRVLYI